MTNRDGQWYGATHVQVRATQPERVRTATQQYREGAAPWSNLTERERARYYGRPQRDNVGEREARRTYRPGESHDDHEMISAAIGETSARGYLSHHVRNATRRPVPASPVTAPVVDKARAAANRLRQVESFARAMASHPRDRWESYARRNVPRSIRDAVIVAAGIYCEATAD